MIDAATATLTTVHPSCCYSTPYLCIVSTGQQPPAGRNKSPSTFITALRRPAHPLQNGESRDYVHLWAME